MDVYVAIITDPEGTPVSGSDNTFDYPILSSISLLCMATTADGSLVTGASYSWTVTDCYNHTTGVDPPCFYYGGQTIRNITTNNLLAQDAGSVTCIATVDGVSFTSDSLTLHISGEYSCRVEGYTLFIYIMNDEC